MKDKININDLVADFNSKGDTQHQQDFSFLVQKDQHKKIQALSKNKQKRMKRETNYNYVKEDMDKWVGIVKINRQKQSLNFENKQHDDINMNFFPQKPINDFQKSINQKLSSMNLETQKIALNQEKNILGELDEEQAKQRLAEARKHRATIFKEEQKHRRIAKIKSKVYRKIKKRQKLREKEKEFENMGSEEKSEYIEKALKRRIEERINLRHKAKNKYIEKLLRFKKNQRKSIQESMNEVNEIRRKELEKIDQEELDKISEEYDDENFNREEQIKQLEAEIQAIENENEQAEDEQIGADLNFRKRGKERRNNQIKTQAKKLLKKLQDDNMESESEEEQKSEEVEEIGRKTYGASLKQNQKQKMQNKKGIEARMKQYLSYQQDPNKLTQGVSVNKLQQKYNPERVNIDLTTLISQNKQIYKQDNEAVLENIRDFNQEKLDEYEKQIEVENKKNQKAKGWGSWAGPGISEKKVNQKEELKKKLRKIEEIKRKRKDGSLALVTINETRNKNFSDYVVKDLPRNFSNADQFDYLQNSEIGPEWNSLNQFKDNIKPKVNTKVGQVINAIKLPKNVPK